MTYTTERRAADFIGWCMAGIFILVLLTGCNPYAGFYPSATPSPSATIASLLTDKEQATPAPTTCTVTTGIPVDGALNLRVGPATSFEVIRVLTEGEVLTVIERGPWLKVITSRNESGFINSRYCVTGE